MNGNVIFFPPTQLKKIFFHYAKLLAAFSLLNFVLAEMQFISEKERDGDCNLHLGVV
jgi:hypothetical protein